MKKAISAILATSLLLGSQAIPVSAESSKFSTEIGATSNYSSNLIKSNIYNLSDQQMRNAIKIGNGGLQSLAQYQRSQRLPIQSATMDIWQPTAYVSTPYTYIAQESCLAFRNYQQYTLTDAKKVKDTFLKMNEVTFDLTAYGGSIDFASSINMC